MREAWTVKKKNTRTAPADEVKRAIAGSLYRLPAVEYMPMQFPLKIEGALTFCHELDVPPLYAAVITLSIDLAANKSK